MQTEQLQFLDNHVSIAVAQADNQDRISVIDMRMPFGEAPPVHVHHAEDEIFHILEGEYRFEVDGRSVSKRAGETIMAPRGIPHGFRVVSEGGGRALIITRGGFESMVRAMSTAATTTSLPARSGMPSPEMQASLAAECACRRIDLVGPPIA